VLVCVLGPKGANIKSNACWLMTRRLGGCPTRRVIQKLLRALMGGSHPATIGKLAFRKFENEGNYDFIVPKRSDEQLDSTNTLLLA
jgi:hypothetical protein